MSKSIKSLLKDSVKTYLKYELGKKIENASEEVATPTSPIPPARASDDINKNGVAVVICALIWRAKHAKNNKKALSFYNFILDKKAQNIFKQYGYLINE